MIQYRATSHRARAAFVLVAIAATNIGAWLLTWKASSTSAFLLASGWLAYSFGLRHAVNADHISAIDNVTRKLTRGTNRPLGVGLFFSLGHSTVVILLCAGFAASATYVQTHIEHWKYYGNIAGTVISGVFLYVIGFINLLILLELYRTYRNHSAESSSEPLPNAPALPPGILGRILAPVLRMVDHSWQMYFVGLLFGLGFDTATEVGILAISARSADHGLAFWVVMLLPLLFTTGMCLVDTLDGILMSGAYGWAALSPSRQYRYSFSITLVSIVVAFFVGTYELAQLLADQVNLHGAVREALDSLDSPWFGLAIMAAFLLIWARSAIRSKRSAESPA